MQRPPNFGDSSTWKITPNVPKTPPVPKRAMAKPPGKETSEFAKGMWAALALIVVVLLVGRMLR